MTGEAIASLVERELCLHNRPNLHVSIISLHNSNTVPTVIDVIDVLFQTSQNTKDILLKNQDVGQEPVLLGKPGSHLIT